jgi:2',3'-cyclic-nucleotide 2'-phosphodiesterase (5'-nucleotidase family)
MPSHIRQCVSLHILVASTLVILAGVVGLASRVQRSQLREVTILYTNDFHSAFDPIPAYWLKRSPKLGGAAQLSTFINQIRKCDKTVFLFDTGDMFTGMLSNLTRGEALMEMMGGMKYDAMAIGNHEFDYGSDNFEKQMYRVPFPLARTSSTREQLTATAGLTRSSNAMG